MGTNPQCRIAIRAALTLTVAGEEHADRYEEADDEQILINFHRRRNRFTRKDSKHGEEHLNWRGAETCEVVAIEQKLILIHGCLL